MEVIVRTNFIQSHFLADKQSKPRWPTPPWLLLLKLLPITAFLFNYLSPWILTGYLVMALKAQVQIKLRHWSCQEGPRSSAGIQGSVWHTVKLIKKNSLLKLYSCPKINTWLVFCYYRLVLFFQEFCINGTISYILYCVWLLYLAYLRGSSIMLG